MQYTTKDLLRGELKGELLEGKRLVTAFRRQAYPPKEAYQEATALVRRLSINREFGFRWPDPDRDVDEAEELVLKALLRDSRRVLRKLRKHINFTTNGEIALDTSKVEINKSPANGIGKMIPPLLLEKDDYIDLANELLDAGWTEPSSFTFNG